MLFFCPLLLFSFVFLPPPLTCLSSSLLCFPPFFFLRREGRRAVFFFFFSPIFARQGREMLGGTAVRNLQQQSESGSCLWMSVSLSPLLDVPEDILYEWCLAVCFLLPGRQRCFVAAGFKETPGLFLLSFFLFPFHWLICLRNTSFILWYHSCSLAWTSCWLF